MMFSAAAQQSDYMGTEEELAEALTDNGYFWADIGVGAVSACHGHITAVYTATSAGGLGLDQSAEVGTGYALLGPYQGQEVCHPKRKSAQNIYRGLPEI
jgi:hypothetical protein